MPTKRRRRSPQHVRFTPEAIYWLAEGINGIDLAAVLRLGRNETLMAVCPQLCRMALAMPRDQLEQFLRAGATWPAHFKLRDYHIENLQRWCGWGAGCLSEPRRRATGHSGHLLVAAQACRPPNGLPSG